MVRLAALSEKSCDLSLATIGKEVLTLFPQRIVAQARAQVMTTRGMDSTWIDEPLIINFCLLISLQVTKLQSN